MSELGNIKDAEAILRKFKLDTNKLHWNLTNIANALQMAETRGMNNPGDCESCRYISFDGELGTIQCCDKDIIERDGQLEYDDELFPIGGCPLWESNSPLGYCKKHKLWYPDNWEYACPSCYNDWKDSVCEDK